MTILAILFIALVPAVLAALTIDTIRAVERQGGLPPVQATYRVYGA
jgi:DNA-binding transcriptional MerR regulator